MKKEHRNSAKLAGKSTAGESTNAVVKKRKKLKRWQYITSALAMAVLLCATYTMILPALTMEQKSYCELAEHTHTEECYGQSLICGREESLPDDEADDSDQEDLIDAESEEAAAHEHTDDCYEEGLACGEEEHTHDLMCYSNPEADVESQKTWERSVKNVDLTGVWADDVAAIAESQLGYEESEKNYIVDEDDNIKGYTRYGAWYGNEYGDWSAMFASFCLNYAEIPSEEMPYEEDCAAWVKQLSKLDLYEEADSYAPQKGDLVFFSTDEAEADHVGIVTETMTDGEETPVKMHVIEGDSENAVAGHTYETSDSHILGYGKLPEKPENWVAPEKSEATENSETQETQENPEVPEAPEDTQPASAAKAPKAPSLAETDLGSLNLDEMNALLAQTDPEELQAYLENLSDEEYDNVIGNLMDNLSEEASENLAMLLAGDVSLLATGDTYVGFARQTSSGDADFAMGGGGAGVKKFYLVPNSVYSQYEYYGNSQMQMYAVQNALLNQSELAYCYNYYKAPPHTRYEVKVQNYGVAKYSEKENASASLFYYSTAGRARETDQNTLYRKVLAMAMNGYPNDLSGIGKTYNLTPDEFRFVTQYAIWYYTDSISLRYKNMSTMQGWMYVFQVYADDTNTCLSLNENGTPGAYSVNNPNVERAYQALINSTLDTNTVNTSHINLYQNINYYTNGERIYQNLLTVGKEDAPPPQSEPNRLKLTKTVSGTAGETNREFTFNIRLYSSSWGNLPGPYTVIPEAISGVAAPNISSITFTNGQATVKLKHGQSITIDGLPDNFRYSITEMVEDGYTSTVTEGSDSNTSGVKGTAAVTYNNRKDEPPPITPSGIKVQVPAKKMIDNGQTAIGNQRFKFKLTGNGQVLYAESNANGNILFPEITYTQPGTYTYTVEEVTDERDGVSFDFDKTKKTVTVTITSQAVQTFDPNATYYAFEELNYDDFEYYYYVDTVPGQKGIVMYCTYQGVSGPQDPTGYNKPAPKDQTYRVVLNPTLSQITTNGWVQSNIYGADLVDNLKKLFYYFETDDAQNIANGDKQSLVWTATGEPSTVESISVNGRPASEDVTTVLNNIYETVNPPSSYNLAFFVPTGTQATKYPQPLATGYGALVNESVGEVVFNNTTKAGNSLKLGKTVSGAAGETDREFNFAIALRSSTWGGLNGTYTVIPEAIPGVDAPELSSITFSDGVATVSLKHGQSITVTGLPDGFYYSISETEWNQNGYTSSITKGPSGNMSETSGVTGAVEVMFENRKDTPTPPPSVPYTAEIEATKTLNGGVPADGQFTFILRNQAGDELARTTNDANGKIVFPLTLDGPGTYTYTIEELNDHQPGIVYDSEVKTVTVTVGSTKVQEIVSGDNFVGSNVSDDFYITVNGTTQLDVYCIDGSAGYPKGTYNKVFNPTSAQLAKEVTANNYGNNLAENMRKLLYYFDTHSFTDKVGYTTLTKVYRQELIWCLTGNDGQQHWSYKDNLDKILAESNPPEDYVVIMFASTANAQPVIAGYMPSTEVVYTGRAGTAEFKNTYEYELPETGGIGTRGYAMGGLLLMSGAALLMYRTKLARKKEEMS